VEEWGLYSVDLTPKKMINLKTTRTELWIESSPLIRMQTQIGSSIESVENRMDVKLAETLLAR
jgi:hypothetical protein